MKTARTRVTTGYLRFILVVVPLLVAANTVGPRGCAIDVQCGDVLDLDHGQYRLNGDLVCPAGAPSPDEPSWGGPAAVTITGEGVHFNLNGYTITRDDSSGILLFSGINVTGAYAHINGGSIVDINCPLRGSPDCSAIFLRANAHGAKINGMSLHNNTQGILAIDQASGARIHGNDISGNLRLGIGLVDLAGGAMITDNDLSDTGGYTDPDGTLRGGWGYWGSADDVRLIGNVANNCVRQGIRLSFDSVGNPPGFAERNTIRDNETIDNGRAGILLWAGEEADRPRDNLIQSNTSLHLETPGIIDLAEGFGPAGPQLDCLNTWKDNDFELANPAGCIE